MPENGSIQAKTINFWLAFSRVAFLWLYSTIVCCTEILLFVFGVFMRARPRIIHTHQLGYNSITFKELSSK